MNIEVLRFFLKQCLISGCLSCVPAMIWSKSDFLPKRLTRICFPHLHASWILGTRRLGQTFGKERNLLLSLIQRMLKKELRKFLCHFPFSAVQLGFAQFSEKFVGFKGEKLHDTWQRKRIHNIETIKMNVFLCGFVVIFSHLSGPRIYRRLFVSWNKLTQTM